MNHEYCVLFGMLGGVCCGFFWGIVYVQMGERKRNRNWMAKKGSEK